jgi:hypothetical protein
MQEPAINDTEWGYISSFNTAINDIKLEECNMCNERWFEMRLKNGICRNCQRIEKSGKPHLFTMANNADVGLIPEHLPILTEIEEMLIARVHVHIQVRFLYLPN